VWDLMLLYIALQSVPMMYVFSRLLYALSPIAKISIACAVVVPQLHEDYQIRILACNISFSIVYSNSFWHSHIVVDGGRD